MKKFYMLFILSLLFLQVKTAAQWSSIYSEISADSLIHTLRELTGALPVTIDGVEELITTRLKNTTVAYTTQSNGDVWIATMHKGIIKYIGGDL